MRYTLENGKEVTIPDNEIEKNMKALEISKDEAIDLWLDDNDFQTNEELEELDAKAKKVKINYQARAVDKSQKKDKKPRTVVVSDEKTEIFNEICAFLTEKYEFSIEKQNKLVKIYKNGKEFKLDLVETRQKKK